MGEEGLGRAEGALVVEGGRDLGADGQALEGRLRGRPPPAGIAQDSQIYFFLVLVFLAKDWQSTLA